jgi:hypothetical protein
MILHAFNASVYPLSPQRWRGFRPIMQMHQKRYMKRAGEAGIALRAGVFLTM